MKEQLEEDLSQDKVEETPEEVVVYATAVIDNSNSDKVHQADLNSIEGFIFRETHLRTNIAKLELLQIFKREFRHRFKQTLELKLFVKARNLYENPRLYIWKHLGREEWSKSDDSTVTFNRIHVKT